MALKPDEMTHYQFKQYCERLRRAPEDVEPLTIQTTCMYIIQLKYVDRIGGWMKVWVSERFNPDADEGKTKLEAEKKLDHSYHIHESNDTFTGEVRMLLLSETQGRKIEEVPPMWVIGDKT